MIGLYSWTRRRNIRCGLLLLNSALPLSIYVTDVIASDLHSPGFSATMEYRFKPLQQSLMRTDVTVSEHGYLVQSQKKAKGKGESIIADFVAGKQWLVDHDRSIIHEVPMEPVEGLPELPEALVRLPGFLDSVPCFDKKGTRTGDVEFKGRQVELWKCSDATAEDEDDDELPVKQYFSPELNIVLYSLSRSGLESELTGISNDSVARKLFTPPQGLRSVGIEEFMGVTIPIGQYQTDTQQ